MKFTPEQEKFPAKFASAYIRRVPMAQRHREDLEQEAAMALVLVLQRRPPEDWHKYVYLEAKHRVSEYMRRFSLPVAFSHNTRSSEMGNYSGTGLDDVAELAQPTSLNQDPDFREFVNDLSTELEDYAGRYLTGARDVAVFVERAPSGSGEKRTANAGYSFEELAAKHGASHTVVGRGYRRLVSHLRSWAEKEAA